MRMNKLVSIIMPSHNCGPFVEESIRSVQVQSYTDWELLFVDDCSTDNTVDLVSGIAKVDYRIRIFQNDCRCGAAISRNKALQKAKGRWIAFLDSDDLWECDKLERQIQFMLENNYTFSYTRYQEIDNYSKETGIFVTGPNHITKWGMYAFCWPGCLTVMWDAEKIGQVQVADVEKNNDYALWLRVIQRADCYLLDECLARYRRRSGSISNHSYLTLVKWHYKLFREAEKMSVIASLIMTVVNIIFGTVKKLYYVKRKR